MSQPLTLEQALAEIAQLKAERDEADRRAGAAERKLASAVPSTSDNGLKNAGPRLHLLEQTLERIASETAATWVQDAANEALDKARQLSA
jgi:hypothetical protein